MQCREQLVQYHVVEVPDRCARATVGQLAGGRAGVAGRIKDAAALFAETTLICEHHQKRNKS